MQIQEYKVLLLGEKKTGKTKFLKKLNDTYRLTNNYIPTMGVSVEAIDISHNGNKIRLNIWDTAGDSRFLGLKDKYYIGTELAIIFGNSLNYEEKLPNDIKKFHINHPEYTIQEYKDIIYNTLINN